MEAIEVVLVSPTSRGRLYPRYYEDLEILGLESSVERADGWPIGVNIDNLLILDADSEGTLANVELLIGRSLWEVVEPAPKQPHVSMNADLKLYAEKPGRGRFVELPVAVKTDKDRARALITFYQARGQLEAARLSNRVAALLEGNILVGFYVSLSTT